METSNTIISIGEVLRVAKLVRLELSQREAQAFADQLSEIVSYADRLKKVDTLGIEPLFNTTELANVYRDDTQKYQESLTQDEALSNAPQEDKGFLKTKQVM